jgi:hypothetical protein
MTNNSEDILYLDEFKFRGNSPTLSPKDFEIHVPPSSLKPIVEGSPFSDICGMWLWDKEHRPVLLMQMFRLTPHEKREMSITHIQSGATTIYATPSVFKAEPQPRIGAPELRRCTYFSDEVLVIQGTFIISMNGTTVDIPDR